MKNVGMALPVLLFGWLASAATGQGVVVGARGPAADRFPIGTIIVPGTPLKLRPGDILTVVDANGTRILEGGKGNEKRGDGQQRGVTLGGEGSAAAGVSRGVTASARPSPPNLWDIDFERGGTWCILSSEDAQLWKPPSGPSAMLAITSEQGETRQLRWTSDRETIAWPGGLPIQDGASYVVAAEGKTPTSITLRLLGEAPTSPVEIAQILSDSGCYDQLDHFGIALGLDQ